MVTHLTRSLVERTRHRLRRPDDEAGSLILDILIGMAIFALIAIIAVSAIGQYRMRAYTQAAMSDAEQVATAIAGHVTDNVTKTDAGTYPTGLLDAAALETLDVTVTGTGAQASKVTVTPSETNPEQFTVCVEHRKAFAVYESDAGLTASGDAERENFDGCATTTGPADGGGDGGDGGETEQAALAAPANLSATAQTAPRRIVASWAAVPEATTYTVYRDGAPVWTGPTTEATLDSVDAGDYTLTVTAADTNRISLPSDPATVTIARDNDFLREADVVPPYIPGFDQTWRSGDYDNQSASSEDASKDSGKTRWWTFTPGEIASYTVQPIPTTNGDPIPPNVLIIRGYQTTTTTPSTLPELIYGRESTDLLRFEGRPGVTYKFAISTPADYQGDAKFRLSVARDPE